MPSTQTSAIFFLVLIGSSAFAEAAVSSGPSRPISRMLPSKGNGGRRLVLAEAAPKVQVGKVVRRMLPSKGNGGRRLLI